MQITYIGSRFQVWITSCVINYLLRDVRSSHHLQQPWPRIPFHTTSEAQLGAQGLGVSSWSGNTAATFTFADSFSREDEHMAQGCTYGDTQRMQTLPNAQKRHCLELHPHIGPTEEVSTGTMSIPPLGLAETLYHSIRHACDALLPHEFPTHQLVQLHAWCRHTLTGTTYSQVFPNTHRDAPPIWYSYHPGHLLLADK